MEEACGCTFKWQNIYCVLREEGDGGGEERSKKEKVNALLKNIRHCETYD